MTDFNHTSLGLVQAILQLHIPLYLLHYELHQSCPRSTRLNSMCYLCSMLFKAASFAHFNCSPFFAAAISPPSKLAAQHRGASLWWASWLSKLRNKSFYVWRARLRCFYSVASLCWLFGHGCISTGKDVSSNKHRRTWCIPPMFACDLNLASYFGLAPQKSGN